MKRIVTLALALAVALSCLCMPVLAITYASPTIAVSSGTLKQGSQPGQLKISYSVTANTRASSLGVENIKIYKDTGARVANINGSTSNGLVKNSNSIMHGGTYNFNYADSGEYYYAEVTVFAVIDGEYDSYTHLTSTIKAP